ncbi:MAG: hypothetical protein QM645_03020 [Asticcacaulis sp.]
MPYVLTLPDVPPSLSELITPKALGVVAVAASAGFLLMPALKQFCHGFMHAPVRHKKCLREDKAQWDNMSNRKVDDIVEESFPASDPPANY